MNPIDARQRSFSRHFRPSFQRIFSLGFCGILACGRGGPRDSEPQKASPPVEPEKAEKSGTDEKAADREGLADSELRAAQELIATSDYPAAKAKLAALAQNFGDTKTYQQRGAKLAEEVGVIGKDAPEFKVEKWFREAEVDLTREQPTVLVFFEQWCPHCREEIPKLELLYAKHKKNGLRLVGLTRMTRNSTDKQVEAAIKDVTYPVAKEDGFLSHAFAVSGVPAAAVVKGGKIVWRGHPASIDDAMVNTWLASS